MKIGANRRDDALTSATTLRHWPRKVDFDIWVPRACRPEHDVRPKARTDDPKMLKYYRNARLNASTAGTTGLGRSDRGIGKWAGRHREP
jgi:hypothetical protein